MGGIFISYARKDHVLVEKITDRLRSEGFDLWLDRYNLPPGGDIEKTIESQIDNADAVVVFWSAQAALSKWVSAEARRALEQNKLYPVALDDENLPMLLASINAIRADGRGEFEPQQWKMFVEELRRRSNLGDSSVGLSNTTGTTTNDASSLFEFVRRIVRRRIIGAALSGALIVAAGLTMYNHRSESNAIRSQFPFPEMVAIQPGIFTMGFNDGNADRSEQPVHEVAVGQFSIAKYETTFAQYDAFAEATGKPQPVARGEERGHRPVVNVSWHDATAYTQWLSKLSGVRYRLPTEAEWEYAARAGATSDRWWESDGSKNNANCRDCGRSDRSHEPVKVGSYAANQFGLHDMAGNVWEWVQDCWHDDYTNAPTDARAWLDDDQGNCKRRVLRGGSAMQKIQTTRAAYRYSGIAEEFVDDVGFRVAVSRD